MKKKKTAKNDGNIEKQKEDVRKLALAAESSLQNEQLNLKITIKSFPYALTIFSGAFLLFLVQPLIGKYILPWFGGLPSTWAACLLFFQVVLLAGYCYAHIISSYLGTRTQAIVHIVILVLCLFFLPIIPADGWKPLGMESPILRILALLTVTLGFPYLLLSTTGPLLQAWFVRHMPQTSPYRLYALSNLGSLMALIVYPLLIEPNLTLRTQFYCWSVLFIIFVGAGIWCAWNNFRLPVEVKTSENIHSTKAISVRQIFLWICLACIPSALLLATTNQLSEELSVVPALWIGPLALYLLSFIICFNKDSWYRRTVWLIALVLILAADAALLTDMLPKRIWLQLPIYWGTLFVGCMVCHGELSRLRPLPAYLTAYYLFIALGGAIGGIIVALIAPAIFSGFWEYPLALFTCCLIILLKYLWDRERALRWNYIAALIGLVITGMSAGYMIFADRQYEIIRQRSFYGVIRVDRGNQPDPVLDARIMQNGRIIHGYQYTAAKLRRFPTAYYTADSGIGLAMQVLYARKNSGGTHQPLRAGIVGLGVGVLAAYGASGDYYRFYEINPDVIELAGAHFTYLRDTAAGKEIVLGDARLSLERELKANKKGNFDLLVLDAFTGDAIPLHVLTREAFQLYFQHLKPEGILAVNISNEHLDLRRLLYGLAKESSHDLIQIINTRRGLDSMPSVWVLVTANKQFLSAPQFTGRIVPWPPEVTKAPLIFTDDYSNLFNLLR